MKYLVLVLKGMVYGITNLLPGVGGGLVLILLGIYEPFVDALGNFFLRRDRWREYIPFLGCIGLGMVVAVVGLSHLVSTILERFLAPSMFFFMGLMLGAVPAVLRIHGDMKPSVGRIVALLFGLAFVVGMRMLENLGVHGALSASPNSLSAFLYTTVTSFAAGCASVTPGLDGSYVFLLAGTYQPILDALSALTKLQIQWGILVGLGIGAALGIILWAKAVDTALKRIPAVTYYVVLGLLLGSAYGLWPSDLAGESVPVMALSFVVGVALAVWFGVAQEKQEAKHDLKVGAANTQG